jgi:hypothetical protein
MNNTTRIEKIQQEKRRIDAMEPPANPSQGVIGQEAMPPPPKAMSLADIRNHLPKQNNLLGDRFLCRGQGLVVAGPSGIGKSSAIFQAGVQFALGKRAFGIEPAQQLRVLMIQAEDDSGDMKEMLAGQAKGTNLTEAQMYAANIWIVYENTRSGDAFLAEVLEPLLREYSPDLVILNPLFAYLGADVNQSEAVTRFLRRKLNPLLEKYNCGAIIVHHTPKSTNRDSSKWKATDFMYAGAGSAEITNWARAVMVMEPTNNPRIFKFIAAKRDRRIGWVDGAGKPENTRYFSHADPSQGIFWNPATPAQIQTARKSSRPKKDDISNDILVGLIPEGQFIPKIEFIEKMRDVGLSVRKAQVRYSQLQRENRIDEVRQPRKGTNPIIMVSRSQVAGNN